MYTVTSRRLYHSARRFPTLALYHQHSTTTRLRSCTSLVRKLCPFLNRKWATLGCTWHGRSHNRVVSYCTPGGFFHVHCLCVHHCVSHRFFDPFLSFIAAISLPIELIPVYLVACITHVYMLFHVLSHAVNTCSCRVRCAHHHVLTHPLNTCSCSSSCPHTCSCRLCAVCM